ncbi:aldehyde dehydrogenase (NAD+) [Halopolyspora algeriensis]|uniref:Aldehyde dehydrogenase (NAD+) n=1 Tax=Halopolyspora algeriensis TaxID=1500506 RepID=A0A368VVG1_9ACTN|nr:aldehyde dehydrogenase family protein [Halopolyspora algeriensis]RCW45833.1 aldehyde dehydrogenase (NAD+) [Halopolyspora algeriensis]TQM55248.1 aldehyde dehydrogenase (NAD+) [Halopolyspora algeriensis]
MSQAIGEMKSTVASTSFWSVNPAVPGQVGREFTAATVDQVRDAVRTARAAAPEWAATPPGRRAAVLSGVADELTARTSELALLITREEGKTLAAATGEVGKAAEQFRFAAQLAHQVEGSTYPQESPGTFAYTLRSPLGVVVAITPWNFPVSLAARKIAPALAAGNAVLFKPSRVTAGAGEIFAEACHAAGVPEDVLALVQGDDRAAMDALVGGPEIDAVSFTGSDAVGELLRGTTNARARLQFELGGHNAAVVCADADLARAARAVASGAFELTGQACTATDRVLVEQDVYDDFVTLLSQEVRGMRVGSGEDPASRVGPVATAAQYERLSALLDSAAGAGTVAGQAELDPSVDPDGYWVLPTVLTDVPAEHPLNTDEIFGPLLSVVPVDSVETATARVNASAHGLVTALHTTDLRRAHRFAHQATCGIVKINERTTGNGLAPPFGGWKASSSGAFPEGGRTALDFVTDTKTVYFGYEET